MAEDRQAAARYDRRMDALPARPGQQRGCPRLVGRRPRSTCNGSAVRSGPGTTTTCPAPARWCRPAGGCSPSSTKVRPLRWRCRPTGNWSPAMPSTASCSGRSRSDPGRAFCGRSAAGRSIWRGGWSPSAIACTSRSATSSRSSPWTPRPARSSHSYPQTEGAVEFVCDGGVLYVVVGTIDPAGILPEPATWGRPARRPREASAGGRCRDRARSLWQKADADTRELLPSTLAVSGGRVYFHNRSELICLQGRRQSPGEDRRPLDINRYAWSAPTLVVYEDVVLSADHANPRSRSSIHGRRSSRMEGDRGNGQQGRRRRSVDCPFG